MAHGQFVDGVWHTGFHNTAATGGRFQRPTPKFRNWITPDGRSTEIAAGGNSITPLATTEIDGRKLPTSWRVSLPARGLAIEATPLNPKSWMGTSFPYWEGPIRFSGSHAGIGYLEMTGY